jgi:hypothetical protein
MSTPVHLNPGYYPAPSDEQLDRSPLVYLSAWLDPPRDLEGELAVFTDRRVDPLPEAFGHALVEAIEELTGVELPASSVEVVREDRPPRADGLFPVSFVDLSQVVEYLRQTFPLEVVSVLITLAVESTVKKAREKLSGKKLPEGFLRPRFSPATLELLCLNYVMIDKQAIQPCSLSREPFNTRRDAGYEYQIDDSLPMGWRIAVETSSETYNFIVDTYGQVHELDIETEGKSVRVRNASLLNPEATQSFLKRIIG